MTALIAWLKKVLAAFECHGKHDEKPKWDSPRMALFPLCCQPVRAGGHSWHGRGTTVPHRCQLQTCHGWGARDVAGSILSLGAGSVPFPPSCVTMGSTAQRCPWLRQPGPSTSSLPCVPKILPAPCRRHGQVPCPRGPQGHLIACGTPAPSGSILLAAPAVEPPLQH